MFFGQTSQVKFETAKQLRFQIDDDLVPSWPRLENVNHNLRIAVTSHNSLETLKLELGCSMAFMFRVKYLKVSTINGYPSIISLWLISQSQNFKNVKLSSAADRKGPRSLQKVHIEWTPSATGVFDTPHSSNASSRNILIRTIPVYTVSPLKGK